MRFVRPFTFLVAVLVSLVLSGCVSLPTTVQFTDKPAAGSKIGIVLVEQPKAKAHYTGSIGLLDLAIIGAANSSLNKHLGSLSFEDINTLPTRMQEVMTELGFDAQVINKAYTLKQAKTLKSHKNGVSQNSYSSYQKEFGVDYVLMLRLTSIGTTRPYYGPIPTAPPSSNAVIWGELVDVKTKKVVWYRLTNASGAIAEPWSESSDGYPNLTNAVYNSLNEAMEIVIASLENPTIDDQVSTPK